MRASGLDCATDDSGIGVPLGQAGNVRPSDAATVGEDRGLFQVNSVCDFVETIAAVNSVHRQ